VIIHPPNLLAGKKKLEIYLKDEYNRRRYLFEVVRSKGPNGAGLGEGQLRGPNGTGWGDEFKRVWTGPWPVLFESQNPGFDGMTGYILYRIDGTRAFTHSYYPKEYVLSGKICGLGYYLEYLATWDLMQNGTNIISTGDFPKYLREQQLRKVDLPIRTETPIDEWMGGLMKGIRLAQEASAPDKVRVTANF
jgi:hypothetical protein